MLYNGCHRMLGIAMDIAAVKLNGNRAFSNMAMRVASDIAAIKSKGKRAFSDISMSVNSDIAAIKVSR